MTDLQTSDDLKLIFDKEDAIKQSYHCPSCDEKTFKVDGVLTTLLRKEKRAHELNDMSLAPDKEAYMFRCTTCNYKMDSTKFDSNIFKIVKKAEDLTDIAMNCNPYKGQTWAAKSGFPTEICSINKNPCFRELWKVCPHIGNADLNELLKIDLPIIGEP